MVTVFLGMSTALAAFVIVPTSRCAARNAFCLCLVSASLLPDIPLSPITHTRPTPCYTKLLSDLPNPLPGHPKPVRYLLITLPRLRKHDAGYILRLITHPSIFLLPHNPIPTLNVLCISFSDTNVVPIPLPTGQTYPKSLKMSIYVPLISRTLVTISNIAGDVPSSS